MTEFDGGEIVKNCNEGKWLFWGLLDFHTWRWERTYNYPDSYGERRITERCWTCDAIRQYDLPGGP